MNDTTKPTKRNEKIKNYFIGVLIIAVIGLIIYINKQPTTITNINTNHVLLAMIAIGGGLVIYLQRAQPKYLPPMDKQVRDVADWSIKHYGKPLDYLHAEAEPISNKRSLVHFYTEGLTFTYDADQGVIGGRQKDMDTVLLNKQESELLRAIAEKNISDADLRLLVEQGVMPGGTE